MSDFISMEISTKFGELIWLMLSLCHAPLITGNLFWLSYKCGTICHNNVTVLLHPYMLFDWHRFEISKVAIDGIHLRAPAYPAHFLTMLAHSEFIECNDHRASTFHARHPRDESTEAQVFRENARLLLTKAKEALDQLGIPFWLSSGTCLGTTTQLHPSALEVHLVNTEIYWKFFVHATVNIGLMRLGCGTIVRCL